MFRQLQFQRAFSRAYSSAIKPDIKLLAQLRRETEVSMSKAKEALVKANNDYQEALTWLQKDALASGAKKASKVANRVAGEGLVGTASVNSRSSIIELNCETDFVSRNSVFKTLAARIAATSLFVHEPHSTGKAIESVALELLLKAPLLPDADQEAVKDEELGKTVEEIITQTIGTLGENITLRRAAVVNRGISAAYVHGGDSKTGKIAGVAVLEPQGNLPSAQSETAIVKVAEHVARQVVGFNPQYLKVEDIPAKDLENQADRATFVKETVLTQQGFLMNPEQTVADFVDQTAIANGLDGASVMDFIRWEAGENIDKPVGDFAQEVMQAAKL
ncbi:elongation factor TS-domain-containing protein [Gongronella butleri]|nr:elongation factor TS-domain-containing protein [Gongronella butleri]